VYWRFVDWWRSWWGRCGGDGGYGGGGVVGGVGVVGELCGGGSPDLA